MLDSDDIERACEGAATIGLAVLVLAAVGAVLSVWKIVDLVIWMAS